MRGDLIARFSRGADPGVVRSVAETRRINDQVARALADLSLKCQMRRDSLMLLKTGAVISI